MATMRIRSLKPEFFDSPSTASAGPWARILFMGMWCMADDWGVGPANPKELAASIFPNDDQWTSKELPSLCKEVADSYGVVFYTHRGRPYFQIPTWEDHQITQRRAKRRYPTADDPESVLDQASPELPSIRKELPCIDKEKSSSEQGNRGTGEQGNIGSAAPSGTADADPRPDIESLCQKLSGHIVANGGKEPRITKAWRDSARLLLDRDGRDHAEAMRVLDWSQASTFWRANILSMPKFREKYDQLRLQAEADQPQQSAPAFDPRNWRL